MEFKTLAQRLADHAEAVCEHYLSNGRRHGRYWLVGDVFNTPGRSLYVRLYSSYGGKPPGKWADAANPDHHGDLLDLIRWNRGITNSAALREEALRFLSLPTRPHRDAPAPRNSPLAANRLFHASVPIIGTHGEAYLRARGITCSLDQAALRFHASCYYKAHADALLQTLPAIIARATDLAGNTTGALRLFLDPHHPTKANLPNPRLAMGNMLGHGVRFGQATNILTVGEGVETMLALKSLMPAMPMVAATSAAHLSGLILPDTLEKLYIAVDNDEAGHAAAERLAVRNIDTNIEISLLSPRLNDWNSDLQTFGHAFCLNRLRLQHPHFLSALSHMLPQ